MQIAYIWKTLIQLQSFLLMLITRQWSQSTCTLTRGPFKGMQKGSIPKKNGNLKWHLPLGVAPPPLMAQISILFFTPLFSFAIESYIYERDFTLGTSEKYQFSVDWNENMYQEKKNPLW